MSQIQVLPFPRSDTVTKVELRNEIYAILKNVNMLETTLYQIHHELEHIFDMNLDHRRREIQHLTFKYTRTLFAKEMDDHPTMTTDIKEYLSRMVVKDDKLKKIQHDLAVAFSQCDHTTKKIRWRKLDRILGKHFTTIDRNCYYTDNVVNRAFRR